MNKLYLLLITSPLILTACAGTAKFYDFKEGVKVQTKEVRLSYGMKSGEIKADGSISATREEPFKIPNSIGSTK